MISEIFTFLLLWIVAVNVALSDKVTSATVYWDQHFKTVVLIEGVLETDGDAYGYLNDTLSTTGWSVLEIRAGYGKTPQADPLTFFLAGYLEGFLTAQQMMDHYNNMYPQLIKDPEVLEAVQSFLKKQDSWVREQVKLRQTSDPLWKHAGFLAAQMDGLQAGVADWAKKQGQKPLSLFAVQFLSAVGDLLDLIPALVPSNTSSPKQLTLPGMGHCSALIKMLPGYENLFFAHSSWYTYAATMRVYKHWDFRIAEPNTATGKLSFSSYPGFLVSLDDFYLLGSGLMMTQTTNNVFNSSLFDNITPSSLLAWQRVRLAHSLAHTGEEWAQVFSKHNSGTYNNQYMVLDRSKVKLGHSLEDGALTVVEQIPGLVEYSDQTQALRRGYWPSYNIPFHKKIYQMSGYQPMWDEFGDDFSYDLCPRAKIFRRDQAKVKDLNSLKFIMRFNDYKKDPYSKGDPCKSICCRNDLKTEKPSPGGCYDTKVTDFFLAGDFRTEAVNGPTTQDGLPPFIWDKFINVSHHGLPAFYNFSFVRMQPFLFKPLKAEVGNMCWGTPGDLSSCLCPSVQMEEVKRLLVSLHSSGKLPSLLPKLHLSDTSVNSRGSAAMSKSKKSCPGGHHWDYLIKNCILIRAEPEPSSDVALTAASPSQPSPSTSHMSPTLWSVLALTTGGSILALVLWLIIFIKRRRRTAGLDSGTKAEVLKRAEAPDTGISCIATQSSAHSCNCVLIHAGSEWKRNTSFCSNPTVFSGTVEDDETPPLDRIQGHRIPLPATEQGGTTLVTTKTV